eukprot:4929136-Amphidinium_carterae.1
MLGLNSRKLTSKNAEQVFWMQDIASENGAGFYFDLSVDRAILVTEKSHLKPLPNCEDPLECRLALGL